MPSACGATDNRTSRHLTGKTSTIARNVRVAAEKYGSDGVMVTSLTKAAAHEAAGRDMPIPHRNIGTLHHFGRLALSGCALAETSEGIASWNMDAGEYIMSPASSADGRIDDGPDFEPTVATKGDRYLNELNLLRARLTPRSMWPEHIVDFERRWSGWKQDVDRHDFTDLIDLAADEPCPIPARALFVDEAQDMSALEMRLCRQWAESMHTLTVVGDADQALYGWRGADPRVMADPPLDDAHTIVLPQSYRVPRAVHRAAQQWVRQMGDRREDVTYLPRDDDGIATFHASTYRNPHHLVDEATANQLAGRRVMIQATCAYMLEPTKALLRRQGIPFHHPGARRHADWNPLYAPPGKTRAADRVLSFLRLDRRTWGDEARFWTAGDVWRWCEWLDAERVMLVRGAKAEIKRLVDRDEALESGNLMTSDLLEWFQPEAVAALFKADLEWWQDHTLASHRRKLDYPMRVLAGFGADALRNEPSLMIGTNHSFKGMEADVVYLFPDISHTAEVARRTGGWPAIDALTRQLYVGMTRSKDELYLASPSGGAAVSWSAALAP